MRFVLVNFAKQRSADSTCPHSPATPCLKIYIRFLYPQPEEIVQKLAAILHSPPGPGSVTFLFEHIRVLCGLDFHVLPRLVDKDRSAICKGRFGNTEAFILKQVDRQEATVHAVVNGSSICKLFTPGRLREGLNLSRHIVFTKCNTPAPVIARAVIKLMVQQGKTGYPPVQADDDQVQTV